MSCQVMMDALRDSKAPSYIFPTSSRHLSDIGLTAQIGVDLGSGATYSPQPPTTSLHARNRPPPPEKAITPPSRRSRNRRSDIV